jgi:outer membrane murein-binding lipoprotein Lpp
MREGFDNNVPRRWPRLRRAAAVHEAASGGPGAAQPVALASRPAAPPPPSQAAGDAAGQREWLERMMRRVAGIAAPPPRVELEKIRHRVVRPAPPVGLAPAVQACAPDSVVSQVEALGAELARVRQRETALRGELRAARGELARAASEARGTSERLAAAHADYLLQAAVWQRTQVERARRSVDGLVEAHACDANQPSDPVARLRPPSLGPDHSEHERLQVPVGDLAYHHHEAEPAPRPTERPGRQVGRQDLEAPARGGRECPQGSRGPATGLLSAGARRTPGTDGPRPLSRVGGGSPGRIGTLRQELEVPRLTERGLLVGADAVEPVYALGLVALDQPQVLSVRTEPGVSHAPRQVAGAQGLLTGESLMPTSRWMSAWNTANSASLMEAGTRSSTALPWMPMTGRPRLAHSPG